MRKMTVSKKMTVGEALCLLLATCGMIFFIECLKGGGIANASQEVDTYISAEEAERLKAENEQLKDTIKEMKEAYELQTNLASIKNLEGYSKDDLKRLQEEFEMLILKPRTYEPEDIVPLFYYICGNTDVIKAIYDNGNATLAEAIIETHMYWSGEFKVIKDFIKTWSQAATTEDSQWNDMLYNKCVEAFDTFKYYPEDFEIARKKLPNKFFSEIVSIHEERDVFPEGITKADFE